MLLFVTTPASAQGAGGWACGAYDQTAKRGKAPTPGADDHVYPIVTIHGITGSDQDFDRTIDLSYIDAHPKPPRSMLDLFAGSKQPDQKLPPGLDGVAVYSFSYTPDSLRWVDDSRVGGKFAETIDCLYDKWKVPVSVVAHSMGGLVTRWVANSTDSKGVPRSKKLGKVITLGTPYEGSDMAAWVNGITDSLGPAEYLLGYICGYTGTETGRGSCGPLPLLSALKSEAGRALSAGSAELSALSSWPKDLDVRTIAGSIRLPLNLLGSPLNGSTDVGDLIVPTKSATSDPRPGRVFECRYDTATGAAATQLKKIVGLANPQDRQAQLGRLIGGGPCFHSNLMRNVELSNDVIGELNDWLVARRRGSLAGATVTELRNAWVPAICGYRAGRLIDGSLPNIQVPDGFVSVAKALSVNLAGDDSAEGLLYLQCNNFGGNTRFDSVYVYSSELKVIGRIPLEDFVPSVGSLEGEQLDIFDVRVRGRVIIIDAAGYGPYDAHCCPSRKVTTRFRLSEDLRIVHVP
ncbi:MAG: hypothetical protein WEB06_13265 [Actinomycetota bacterium]